jgi:two-component system response regulator FixJ
MGQAMAKKQQTSVFLIFSKQHVGKAIAEGLTEAGYSVSEYQTAREFLIDKRNHQRGVVLSEIRLLGSMGTELVEQLAGEKDTFPVVLLSNHADIPKAVKSGADFVCGQWTVEKLTDAIERTLSPADPDERDLEKSFQRLTLRELEVLERVVEGKASRDIAADLGVSTKTVEAHRARINDKTRAADVGELIRLWKAWQALE